MTIERNGLNTGTWTNGKEGFTAATYGKIDNLILAYYEGNRLVRVQENSLPDRGYKTDKAPTNTEWQYGYDPNGNLKFDFNKGITGIWYNHLNLPSFVYFSDGRQITFNYTADGELIRKTTYNPSNNTGYWMEYVNGTEFKNWSLNRLPHSEGAVIRNDVGNYEYEYTLKDHLGSNRVVFRDKDNDRIIDTSDIKQINHTYPFGMDMEGNWNGSFMGSGTTGNAYKYNGKEFNNDYGLDWYHYGARFYDPAIGRWPSVDPFSEKYINLSPYNYVANNPVKYVDPNGKEIIIHYLNEQGQATSYTFKSGLKPTTSNVFVQKAYEAISFSMKYDKSNTLGTIIKASNKVNVYYRSMDGSHGPTDETVFSIQNMQGVMSPLVKPNGDLSNKLDVSIFWDPNAMVIPETGGGISPTTNLFHEFIHALKKMGISTIDQLREHLKNSDSKDPQNKKNYGENYDNPEEKRTIDKENEYVKEVNNATTDPTQKQAVRKTHHGEMKKTDDINSIKPKE